MICRRMKRRNCKMTFILFIFNRTLIKMLALTSTLALQNQIKGIGGNYFVKLLNLISFLGQLY